MLTHQIANHDSEDWTNLVDLGYDELGDGVIMNKEVFEADLAVMIGHVLGNPYGDTPGLQALRNRYNDMESIASHHIPEVMHRTILRRLAIIA